VCHDDPMRRRRTYLVEAMLVVGLLAGAEVRAADSSDCRGVVLDENGVPVAAAQIKLEGSGGLLHHTDSDKAGRFIFRNLAPGDYKIEVHAEGFFLLTGQPLPLHAGANDVTLTLNHAQEVHEQVQVTAPANQIDTQDTTQKSAITARDIRDIPVPNTHLLAESLVVLPEIVQDHAGSLHVAGARPGETQYVLDGFEIGDPVNGALTSRFNVDATRKAEVQSSRFSAGYAHAGASILSLETPDGDDKFRFGTTNPVPGVNLQEGVHLGNWYPRFTVSGPVKRGRLWFSDSISFQHTFAVVKEQPSNANTWTEWAGDNLLRLQFNVTPRHIVHASALYDRAKDLNLGLDALAPLSTTVNLIERRGFASVKDQVWWYDTLFEFGVAADSGLLDFVPKDFAPYILLINGTSGNFFERLHQRGKRLQATTNVIAASRHWHGMHQVSLGGNIAGLVFKQLAVRDEIDALRASQSNGQTPCTGPNDPGCLVRRSTFTGPRAPVMSNTQVGGYVQDTWTLTKRLILQPGLRTDWDRFTQTAMVEPRLSGNVLPFGDDRAKLSLGWGIYNAPLNLSLLAQAFDQQQLDTFYDTTGTLQSTVTSQFVLPARGLRQPRFTITSAGWQQKLGKKTLVSLDLLARNGYHGFAYVDQNPAQSGGIFLLEDDRKDRYRSATLSVRHVFSENTEVYGAYSRSRAHSNAVLNPALGSIFYAPQQSAPLAWDAPNRLLTWGWAPTHIWKTQLSYFFEYRTGYPFSVVNLQQQLVGTANSSRFPAYENLNLGLEKKFAFRGYLWAIRGEMVNVWDRLNPESVVNNIDAPNFGAFSGGIRRAFTGRIRFVGRK
jgi:Carboxypeptidase regulatory-like domain